MTPVGAQEKNPAGGQGGPQGGTGSPLKSRRAAASVSPAGETRLFEDVAARPASYTGQYLKKLLNQD